MNASRDVSMAGTATGTGHAASSSSTQAPSPFIGVLMSPLNSLFRIQLEPGRYLIGRSGQPTEDPWFINLESPRSGVSRVHSVLVLSRNGDAWILDNESTNGTFLAIRDGEGIKLDPKHYYQLTSGALILFGDTEIRFLLESRHHESGTTGSVLSARAKSQASQRTAPLSAAPQLPASLGEASSGSLAEPQIDKSGMLAALAHLADYTASNDDGPAKSTATVNRSRGAMTPPSQHTATSHVAAPPVKPEAVEVKQEPRGSGRNAGGKRAPVVDAEAHAPPAARRLRRDDARTFRGFGSKVQACLTGFDSRSRKKYSKAVTNAGGTVEDDWSPDCNLLLVNASPTLRTAKVIMAVAQGRDVVTPVFVDKGDIAAEDACPAVSIDDQGGIIDARTIRAAIWKYRDLGLPLKGRSFYTGDVEPKASRDLLNVILKGCGATVAKAKSKDATVLVNDEISAFYNSILRGDGVSK